MNGDGSLESFPPLDRLRCQIWRRQSVRVQTKITKKEFSRSGSHFVSEVNLTSFLVRQCIKRGNVWRPAARPAARRVRISPKTFLSLVYNRAKFGQ